jgi:hypothetical protein
MFCLTDAVCRYGHSSTEWPLSAVMTRRLRESHLLSKIANPRDLVRAGVKQASNALRRVRTGPVVAGLVVSVAVEGALFAKEAMKAYRKYRAGEISRDDFRQQLAKVGCECAGGVIASTAGSVIGQLVIPVPVLGSFVGCTLGNLIGRYCGAMIGKQLVNVK